MTTTSVCVYSLFTVYMFSFCVIDVVLLYMRRLANVTYLLIKAQSPVRDQPAHEQIDGSLEDDV